jgi:hypothetical protein
MPVTQDLEIVAAILAVGLAPMLLAPPGVGAPTAVFGAGRRMRPRSSGCIAKSCRN